MLGLGSNLWLIDTFVFHSLRPGCGCGRVFSVFFSVFFQCSFSVLSVFLYHSLRTAGLRVWKGWYLDVGLRAMEMGLCSLVVFFQCFCIMVPARLAWEYGRDDIWMWA